MSAQQSQITTYVVPEKKNQDIDFGRLTKKYLYHWPLFLVFGILIFPLAYYYVYVTPSNYDIKASILIKDDTKKQDKQPTSALHEIDLINSAKVVENEIEILHSRNLVTKVVQDLDLSVNYKYKDGMKMTDLYNNSPVKFVLTKPGESRDKKSLEFKIIDKKSFDLKTKDGEFKRYNFNRTYKSNFGSWELQPTKNISKYLSKTIKIELSNIETAAIKLQKSIDVSLTNKLSTAVVLTIVDQIPERGKDILNRLILNYNLEATSDKNRDIKNTIDFLDQKIAELSGDLGNSEKNIEGFKSSKGLTDISMQTQVSLQNLQANDNKLNEANIQLDIINRIDNYVNSAQNSQKAPSANGITDLALSSLIEKLSNLQLQYEELAANTPETSPEFETLNRQIRTTKLAIKESVRNIKLALQSTRDKLQSYNSSFESSIRNIPTQERQYVNIKRQQSSKESLYTYYLQKREEATANYAATLTDDKVIDKPYQSLPKSPKKMAYGLAIFLVLFLPVGLVYSRTVLSNKIFSINDINNLTAIPVIAELPREQNNKAFAISDRSSTPTSEQFRALRTRLHHLHKERASGRVTLITSSIPGEGKSFISTNLSISLAYTQRKTILLELDMRKPKIAQTFKLEDGKLGLSDYFMGKATVSEIIQNSEIEPNLYIISSGSTILNPSELLERKELNNLIEELRRTYDDIIIDSPPAHLVPDATIVSPFADVCLYVVRQAVTEKAELIFLNDLVSHDQLTKVSIVFNGLENQKFGYGYDYNSGYYNSRKKSVFNPIFGNFWKRF